MNLRVTLGWVVTFSWVLFWTLCLYVKSATASEMTFNEWGDFFAGVSAPLAFLWLVIGYFQQGEELSQNTRALKQQEEALRLQVEELKQSVAQQEALVDLTRREFEINKNSIERNLQKEKARAQPLIRPGSLSPATKNGQTVLKLAARNIGHLIRRVSLELVDSPPYIELHEDFFDSWDYNSEKTLDFIIRGGHRMSPDVEFRLVLTYIDGAEEESSYTLFVAGTKSGGITFSSEFKDA